MRRAALAVLVLAGCSSASTPVAECALRIGRYFGVATERDGGTCGPVPASTSVETGQPPTVGAPGPCSGHWGYSTDKCAETGDVTCPGPEAGTDRVLANIDWDRDASSGRGTLQAIRRDADGGVFCESTYDVTFVRQ
jgi:hypothetical protein